MTDQAQKAAWWEYDSLELACWGDHFDPAMAVQDPSYWEQQKKILEDNNLSVASISHHLAGQLVCDRTDDSRSDGFAPEDCAGDPEKRRV